MGRVKIRVYGPAKNFTGGVGEIVVDSGEDETLRELIGRVDSQNGYRLLEALEKGIMGLKLMILCGDRELTLDSKVPRGPVTIHIIPPAAGG